MSMGKLKIAGAWSGVLEVELDEWTVAMLREEVAKRSGCVVGGPESINLISAGKVLKDGDGLQKLAQLGIKNNAKILASRVSPDQAKYLKQDLLAEEQRSTRLSRIKAAATSLAKRHSDGSLPVEDFNLELENQSGQRVHLGSETDQRAVMMGLMLHTNAKQLIKRKQYNDALEVLTMGEEAFSLCNPKFIELVDNVSILQIDMAWCYFMLGDINWLSIAGRRLAKAREGIERSHGKGSNRVSLLQGGRHPELALHLRLELLEGVVAYHTGQLDKSRKALTSARSKYFLLQVPDEALSLLISMGYKECDAKRALRMCNQDVESAVDFLVEEKKKKAQKRKEDLQRQKEIFEQKQYGVTPLRKAVDLWRLNELVSIGFERELAAEALRRNENDTQKALDDLTNPATNTVIQLDIETRKGKILHEAADAAMEELVSMGFPSAAVAAAFRRFGTKDQALNHLLGNVIGTTVGVDGNINSSSPSLDVGPSTTSTNDSNGGPSTHEEVVVRDVEVENELKEDLRSADAFSDYDIEVTKEGEAINEYLAMLDTAENNGIVSSKQ